jgi:anti-sigma B factor antagonist
MLIGERAIGDVTILDIKGKFLIGCGEPLLDKVKELIESGRIKVLLNLAEVACVDSAGLGESVRSYVLVKRQGGVLKLLRPNERFRSLLHKTKLSDVFEIFDDEGIAVESFESQTHVA